MTSALILAFSFVGFIKSVMMFLLMFGALLLMLIVLIQEPKGGGLSSAFGGVGAETFGVQTGGVNKFTAWVAGIWMLLAVLFAAIREDGGEAPSLRDTEAPPGIEKPEGVDRGPSDSGSSEGGPSDEGTKDEGK